jgi:hypothetical protein
MRLSFVHDMSSKTLTSGITSQSRLTSDKRRYHARTKLDFVQLRSIAERFSEALQQCAWDFNQICLLLGR